MHSGFESHAYLLFFAIFFIFRKFLGLWLVLGLVLVLILIIFLDNIAKLSPWRDHRQLTITNSWSQGRSVFVHSVFLHSCTSSSLVLHFPHLHSVASFSSLMHFHSAQLIVCAMLMFQTVSSSIKLYNPYSKHLKHMHRMHVTAWSYKLNATTPIYLQRSPAPVSQMATRYGIFRRRWSLEINWGCGV